MRMLSYWSERKLIPAAGGTITWSGNEIDTDGLVGLVLSGSGVGAQIAAADLATFRVKGARSGLVVDLDAAELRGFIDSFSWKAHALATTDVIAVIPLNMLDMADPDAADRCGWPIGDSCTVEITAADAVGGGFLKLGFIRSTVVPELEPRIIGSAMNIGASQTGAPYKFAPPPGHFLRAISINNANLTRLQLTVSGQTVIDMPAGGDTEGMLIAAQLLNGIASGSGNVNPLWLRTPNLNVPAQDGSTFVRLDTGAGWSAANRLGWWSVGRNTGRRAA